MDPGIGLIVNSIAPNLPEVPKLPPKSMLQLPDGFLVKPHVRHALKYMTNDEQREKALEIAMTWKKNFAAEKWKPVVAAIEAANKEDNVRSPADVADLHYHDLIMHPAERARAMTTAPAPAVPQATPSSMSRRVGLMRQHTATALPLRRTPAPITPRTCRWDVIAPGPVTPLSPMPVGNSFAEGAFWNIPTPQGEQHEGSKYVMAMTAETTPLVTKDAEARAAYQKVKDEIEAVACRYYLARFNTYTFGEDDVVPVTMLKPKDLLEAAQVVLDSRRVKLKEVIVKDLPERLRRRAAEETTLRGQLCINSELDVAEQNDWVNHEVLMPASDVLNKDKNDADLTVHSTLSILDEQRKLLRSSRAQRESTDLKLSDMALEAAWAVRILEDAECLVAAEADDSSSGGDDDDDGYSYGNFLRNIKSELSMSTSSSSRTLASTVDELSDSDFITLRSRSNTHQTVSSITSRESRSHHRSSTRSSKVKQFSTRQSKLSIPNSNEEHSTSLYRRRDLRVATGTIDEIPSSELSPEDREFRHRGPDRADLDYWAEELRKMEAMQADRQRSPTVHRRGNHLDIELSCSTQQRTPTQQTSFDRFNAGASPPRQFHSWFSSSSSSPASSAASHASQTLPRSLHADYCPSLASSVDKYETRSTMLDHEYHQCNSSKASIKTHRQAISKASMHDSSRRQQSVSSVSVLIKRTTKEEEDEWVGELRRMESRERARQANERRRTSQLLEGDD